MGVLPIVLEYVLMVIIQMTRHDNVVKRGLDFIGGGFTVVNYGECS